MLQIIDHPDEGWATALHLLDIFKAGFYSKSPEVALWTCRLMSRIATELHGRGMGGSAWEWFVAGPTCGLQGVLHCADKNRSVPIEAAVSVLCQFGKFNCTELFTHHLKQAFPEVRDYMIAVAGLVPSLAEYKQSRDEMAAGGVLRFWIELGCSKGDAEPAGANTPDERAAALGLLFEIWTCFSGAVEEQAECSDRIMQVAQRANRDRSECLQLASLAMLFRLLDTFAAEKNPYAPVVYKTLTFALVENHQKVQVREFILNNFRLVFETFPTIPPAILLEPFIKQIRRSEGITFFYNVFDFEFFLSLARHPRLKTKGAVQTLDLLAKTYLYDELFAGSAFSPFMFLAFRFKDDPSFVTFILKLGKFVLGLYSANAKKVSRTGEHKSAKYLRYINARIGDDKAQFQLQNGRILELLARVIELENPEVCGRLKSAILEENATVKSLTKADDVGLLSVLGKLGDAQEMINEFEAPPKKPAASPVRKRACNPLAPRNTVVRTRRVSQKAAQNATLDGRNETKSGDDRSAVSERETVRVCVVTQWNRRESHRLRRCRIRRNTVWCPTSGSAYSRRRPWPRLSASSRRRRPGERSGKLRRIASALRMQRSCGCSKSS